KFSSVDLPEPELPSRAKNSPVAISSEISFTARIRVSPKRYSRETFSAWMRVGVGAIVGSASVIRSPGILDFVHARPWGVGSSAWPSANLSALRLSALRFRLTKPLFRNVISQLKDHNSSDNLLTRLLRFHLGPAASVSKIPRVSIDYA